MVPNAGHCLGGRVSLPHHVRHRDYSARGILSELTDVRRKLTPLASARGFLFERKEKGMAKLELYDTTLRDGTQREGISLSVKDKLEIARRIDQLGIHYIESGWTGADPKDVEFFQQAQTNLQLKHARLVAFGSTRRAHGAAENDPTLAYLVDSRAPICCIVGKSSAWQVKDVLGTTPDENLEMVGESIAFLKSKGRTAFYDAEHVFDGFKAGPEYSR